MKIASAKVKTNTTANGEWRCKYTMCQEQRICIFYRHLEYKRPNPGKKLANKYTNTYCIMCYPRILLKGKFRHLANKRFKVSAQKGHISRKLLVRTMAAACVFWPDFSHKTPLAIMTKNGQEASHKNGVFGNCSIYTVQDKIKTTCGFGLSAIFSYTSYFIRYFPLKIGHNLKDKDLSFVNWYDFGLIFFFY
jgi:hypothetical protein